MITVPREFQNVGIARLDELDGRALLADEMGLGKTLEFFGYAENNPQARPIVVVCPAHLRRNWEKEAYKHLGWRATILESQDGHPPLHPDSPTPRLVIVSYDILPYWMPYLRSLDPQLVGIDEGHYIANRGTQRTRAVKALCEEVDDAGYLARRVPHVIVITATPYRNGAIELYEILHLLKPEKFNSRKVFGDQYTKARIKFGRWTYTGTRNHDELNALLLDNIMIRRLKKDVIAELPEKQRIVVPLDIEDRAQYLHAVDDFLGWIRQEHPGRLGKTAKAVQITKFNYLKGLVGELKAHNVLAWHRGFLEQSQEKIIAFTFYKKMADLLSRHFRKECVLIDGSVSMRDREIAERRFDEDPDVRVLVGNIKAAGTGLTATAAHNVSFPELAWTAPDHWQAEDRCYARLNDMHGATAWYLPAMGTIEERICQMVQDKSEDFTGTFDPGRGDDLDIYDLLTEELLKERTGPA